MRTMTPPTVGPTGSPVVSSKVSATNRVAEHLWGPPVRPDRTVLLFGDDDEIIGEKTLTEEEYATAMANYERSMAEWKRTGGVHREHMGTDYTADVLCEDGSTGEAVSVDGERWAWVAWATPGPTAHQ